MPVSFVPEAHVPAPREELQGWSDWIPLEFSPRFPTKNRPVGAWNIHMVLDMSGGLYRIRLESGGPVCYVGQSSRSVRQRLSRLAGIYWRDGTPPDGHCAGRALWGIHKLTGRRFEVSVVRPSLNHTTAQYEALEAVAIAQCRQKQGCSPLGNFMLDTLTYYPKSTEEELFTVPLAPSDFDTAPADIEPTGPLDGWPHRSDWCGHQWAEWTDLEAASKSVSPQAVGLYRIRAHRFTKVLIYIGQGKLQSRLDSFRRMCRERRGKRGSYLSSFDGFQASWIMLERMNKRQLLGLECDLIAAHVLRMEHYPAAQFFPRRVEEKGHLNIDLRGRKQNGDATKS